MSRSLANRAKAYIAILLGSAAVLFLLVAASGWQPHSLRTPPFLRSYLKYQPPSFSHPFGTNGSAIDVYTQTLAATRTFIMPAIVAVAIPLFLGVAMGAAAGYPSGGPLPALINYLMDLLDSLPKLIIVLAAIIVVNVEDVRGLYPYLIAAAIGFTFTPLIFYNVRQKISDLKSSNFVETARCLGAGEFRILFKHLLWNNCRSILLVHSSYLLGYVMLLDATVGYLLKVAQPDYLTLGGLVYEGVYSAQYEGLAIDAFSPWIALGPLLTLVVIICGFTLIGDGLRILLQTNPDQSS